MLSFFEKIRASTIHLVFPVSLIVIMLIRHLPQFAKDVIQLTTSHALFDVFCQNVWDVILSGYISIVSICLYFLYYIYSDVTSSSFERGHLKACLPFIFLTSAFFCIYQWLGSSANGIAFIKEPLNFHIVPIIFIAWFSQSFFGAIKALLGKQFHYLLPTRSVF